MKINVTFLFVLMLLSTSVTMAQKPLSVEKAETTTATSSETTKSSVTEESSYELETFKVSEGAIDNSDADAQRQLQENKTQSEKASAERAKITEAVRQRLKKVNQTKAITSELLEKRKKRAAFINKNRVQDNPKDLAKKEAKQN